MAEPLATLDVFVNQENCINFCCPACANAVSIKVESLKKKITPLKVRCHCGATFNLEIDYRVYYRKNTNFSGSYWSIQPRRVKEEEVLVVNISREGIRFRVFKGHKIQVGDKLEIKFNLDDKKRTPLCKVVDVISVDRDYIGCHFSDLNTFEQALGYYLQR